MIVYLQLMDAAEERSKFEQLYARYRQLMFYTAFQILKRPQDAEDAVHQAFLSIAENISINISLKQTLGTIAVATLATIIVGILPISKIASVVAGSVIGGLGSGFAAYFSSTTLYCKETIYKNKYIGISYDKKVHQKYYYDSELTDAVPDSEKTLYASWG